MPLYSSTGLSALPVEEETGLADEFSKGFGAGVDQLQALGGGFLALAGSAFGKDDWFYDGIDYYNEQMEEAAENAGAVSRIEDIDGIGELLAYTAYTAGNVLPSLIGGVGVGAVGAKGAKIAADRYFKSKFKTMADDLVQQTGKQQLSRKVVDQYRDEVLAGVGRTGAVAGAVGFGAVMGGGENFMRQLEENGVEAPGIAFATGIASGALDAIAPLKALKKILPEKQFVNARTQIGEEVLKQRRLFRRVAEEGAKIAGIEGLTEATQEFVQNASVGWVKANLNPEDQTAFIDAIASETAMSAYLNAFVAGAIGGGVVGGVSGLPSDPSKPAPGRGDRLTTDDLAGDFDPATALPAPAPVADPEPEKDMFVDSEGNVVDDISPEARMRRARDRARAQVDTRTEQEPVQEGVAQPEPDPQADRRRIREEEEQQRIRNMIAARRRAQRVIREEAEVPITEFSDPQTDAEMATSLVGSYVRYQGVDGVVEQRPEGLFVVGPDEEIFIESGERQTVSDLGIESDPLDVTWDAETSTFGLRGRQYQYISTVSDDQGNTIGIRAIDDAGQQRTIRTRSAITRVERLKIEAETARPGMEADVPVDVLPPVVQKKIKDNAEEQNTPIPDMVPVPEVLDVAEEIQNETGRDVLPELDDILTDTMLFYRNLGEFTLGDVPVKGPKYHNSVRPWKAVKTKTAPDALTRDDPMPRQVYNDQYAGINLAIDGYDQPATMPEITEQDDQALLDKIRGEDRVIFAAAVGETPKRILLRAINGEDGTPEIFRLKTALYDLVASGMPKQIISMVDSFRTTPKSDTAYGAYLKDGSSLQVRLDLLEKDTPAPARDLRFTLAHEIAHALDDKLNYAAQTPEFAVAFDGIDPDGVVKIDAGPVVGELYGEYIKDSPVGRVMTYPFASMQDKVESKPAAAEDAVRFLRSEVFAQSFALFLSNPAVLKEHAPKTFAFMQKLRRDERILSYGQDSTQTEVAQPDSGQVQGDVRSPAQPRSPPDDGDRGSGPVGGSSPVPGQAGDGVGGETADGVRVNDRPPVQEGQGRSPEVISNGDGTYEVTLPDGTTANLRIQDNGDIVDDDTGDVIGEDTGRGLIVDINGTAVRLPRDPGAAVDVQEINFADLSQQGQNITASKALYDDEQIPVQVEGNRATLKDLARAFDSKTQSALNGADLSERSPENADLISDIIAHEASMAMMMDGNAGDWYQTKIANANQIAADFFPELANPDQRVAFTLIQAITSNGASVQENSVNTFDLYEEFRSSGKFPEKGFGKESPSMVKSFKILNRMLDKGLGLGDIREFMMQETTVRQLKEDGFNISGENMDTVVYGSSILGPKIGQGFFQNLMGNYAPLTMDRWFMRTWGRVTGTLMKDADRKLPEKLAEFKEAAIQNKPQLRADGVLVKDLRASDDAVLSYALRRYNEFQKGSFKDKTPLNALARQVFNASKPKEAPGAGSERAWIREVMQQALTKVNAFNSNADPINMGALQAIIWYPEKDLYKKLGVGNARSEPTDYETEFRKIAEARRAEGSRVSGPVGSALQSGAGGLQPGSGVNVGDQDQPSGRQAGPATQGLDRRPEQRRDTVLQQAVRNRIDRNITAGEFREIQEERGRPIMDITPDQVPEVLSDEKAINALSATNSEKPPKPRKETYWMAPLKDGERYGVRLDIPSYTKVPVDERADIVTVHAARKVGSRRGGAGKRLSYRPSIRMKNVDFIVPEKGATAIALGADKNTIATIEGTYVAAEDSANRAAFIEAISDPAWTQISMNPERSSEFYDMQGNPIRGADEMIQFGNLVIAKNVNSIDTDPSSETFGQELTVDDILYSMDPEIEGIAEKVLSRPESDVTYKEKASRVIDGVVNEQGYIAEKAQRFVQGVFDESNRIGYLEKKLNEGKLKDGSESAYKAALWTKNIDTIMQAVLVGGPLQLKDGSFQLVEGQGGFYDIFAGYDREQLREWELWAAANRAKRLLAEDRERLFSAEDISTVLNRAKRNGTEAKYKDTLAKWTAFNRKILDLSEQTGILDPNKRRIWDKDDYVPFFRFSDEENVNDLQVDAINIKRGLSNQGLNIKQLKGGEGKINPVESMVAQITTMVDRSFKNEAMRRVVRDSTELGVMREVSASEGNLKLAADPQSDLVKVFSDGQAKVYQVLDPMLYRSISSLGSYQLSKFSQVFGIPKQVLTRSVTIDPGFMVANAVRDILSASIQFESAPGIIKNVSQALNYVRGGLQAEATGTETEEFAARRQNLLRVMASGGLAIGDFYGTGRSDEVRADLMRINSLDTTLNTQEKQEAFYRDWIDYSKGGLKNLWAKWNRVGQTFEQASRVNLYEQAIENGATHAEAVSQAADILNFSMKGDYWLVKEIINAVPFLNARLQGLNVLGRSIRDNGENVLKRGLALSAATSALYMINRENEEYEQLPDYDKDLNWHFFIGGEHFRLPKPFEVGLAFATMPERAIEASINEDAGYRYFWDGVKDGVTTTLSMDMMPQTIKPLVEAFANEDTFRERRIVSGQLEDAPPELQFNQYTSDFAKFVAQSVPEAAPEMFRSPMKLEFILRGYFSSFASLGSMIMDPIVRDPELPDRPEKLVSQYPVLKRFYRTDIQSSKYADLFYSLRSELDDINREYNTILEEGRTEEMRDYLNDIGGYDVARQEIRQYYKRIKVLNKKRDLVYQDKTLSAEKKAQMIQEIYRQRNAIFREAYEKHRNFYPEY